MILPAPEWTPDLTTEVVGSDSDIIQNVIPDVDSYRPWQNLTTVTTSLGARAQGAFGAIDSNRVAYDYCGDVNNLYRLVSVSWVKATNVTLSATYSYSTGTERWWEFEQWNNTIIATNGNNPVQEITMGSTNFVDLAGVPPVAYHIAAVKDFMWLGNISGSPQRVQWCGINNTHTWTVDAATQADYQDLLGDGGQVQRIIGGDNATVFQERAIWRAQYVGSPGIFDFGNGPIVRDVGLLATQSAARYGPYVFFLAEGGFYRLGPDGAVPIGNNKIDRTFFNDLDSQYVERISAAIHPIDKLYIVAYPGAGNTSGACNKILVYNFAVNRWSIVSEDTEMLFRYISPAYTLEGLDVFGTLDALPASLDSSLWAGGQIALSAFTTGHAAAVFNGTAKNATVTTSEFAPFAGQRGKITRVRPLVDNNAASVTPITRTRLADARAVGTTFTQRSTGDVPMRVNAAYISLRIDTTGDFTRIRGAEILEAAQAGNR